MSPVNFEGMSPWLRKMSIFDSRLMIAKIKPPEPEASAKAWMLGMRLAKEKVDVRQDTKIWTDERTRSNREKVSARTYHYPMASGVVLTLFPDQLRSVPKDDGDATVEDNIDHRLGDSHHQTFLDSNTFPVGEILRVSIESEEAMLVDVFACWSHRSASLLCPPKAVTVRIAPSTSWATELAVLYAFSSNTVNLMIT